MYSTKRPGRYRCGNPDCRKHFSVTTGTVMERSHIPLNKWLMGFYVLTSSKKGFSAHQLHRTSASPTRAPGLWRTAFARPWGGGLVVPIGGSGKVVEADETYFGQVEERRPSMRRGEHPYAKGGRFGPGDKRAIVSQVERGGNVRSFRVAVADGETVRTDRP
jgi:hypothetical protein